MIHKIISLERRFVNFFSAHRSTFLPIAAIVATMFFGVSVVLNRHVFAASNFTETSSFNTAQPNSFSQFAQLSQRQTTISDSLRSSNTPSTKGSTASATTKKCSAAASDPARLIISSIGLDTCFAPIGIDSNNQIEVHPSLAGWLNNYTYGNSKPGQSGNTFIDGHTPGVLSRLTGIPNGAIITIELGNGTRIDYRVSSRETVPLSSITSRKMIEILQYRNSGASESLSIMTCNSMGTNNASYGRFILYATRV